MIADQPLLGFALLGLIRVRQPCSGYDLRGIFAGQPMGIFSDSPGSIYPALQRLEESGLVTSFLEETTKVRRRRLYRIGPKGQKALKQWLQSPIEPEDAARRLPELFLRFSFIEECLGPKACEVFLDSLSKALEKHLAFLHDHFGAHEQRMPRSARLALQNGIMSFEGQLNWARMAIEVYRQSHAP